MAASQKIILAFDLYGTLLSTRSIAAVLAEHFGQGKGDSISDSWRRYQLEYTWRLNSMGIYEPFLDVTRKALLHGLAENSVSLDNDSVNKMMEAYDDLSMFPDVLPALKRLAANPQLHAVVFSNGTESMVTNSVKKSKDLSPHAHLVQDIISVEPIKKFKPAPETYYHLADRAGKQKSQMGEMWLISGNPFDIVGARNVGMKAAWVDRIGQGWIDSLSTDLRPTVIASSLEEVIKKVEEYASQ